MSSAELFRKNVAELVYSKLLVAGVSVATATDARIAMEHCKLDAKTPVLEDNIPEEYLAACQRGYPVIMKLFSLMEASGG